jgi:TIR domain
MQGKIFISYRRATDAWAVEKLRHELVGAFGEKNVFLDKQTIEAGVDWNLEIDNAIRDAAAVVVVFSQEWYGAVDELEAATATATGAALESPPSATPPKRRIDDPNDKLRIEVEMAARHNRLVFPVIVDGSSEPRPEELPEGLRFVCKRQFLRIDVSGNFEAQMDRLIGAIRSATMGTDWLHRLIGQSFWLGLLALSLVMAWSATGTQASFRNGFARSALEVRESLVSEKSNVAIVEMGEPEYRELFGGRNPLDPELVRIMLDRFRAASTRCDDKLPLVLNVDIAPNTQDNEDGHQADMTWSLQKLAECRPIVLVCPQAVRRGSPAWHEMRWMRTLRKDMGHRIRFGTGMADPEGLRRGAGRSELGVLAADMAAGRAPFAGHPKPDCVCPDTPELASACAEVPLERAWDDRGFAVPVPGSSDSRQVRLAGSSAAASLAGLTQPGASFNGTADNPSRDEPDHMFSLNEAVLEAERLMGYDAILIGSNRSQNRYAVPGRPRRAFEGVSGTVVQAHLLNGAMNHEPVRGSSLLLLIGLLAGWLVAAVTLLGGMELERNDQRYSHRGGAYLLFVLGLGGVPLLTLVLSAYWPGSIWWLSIVALVALAAAARAVMSCFEIVLSRGLAWRWPQELHREYLHGSAKASTLLRLLTFAAEAALIVACWLVVVLNR